MDPISTILINAVVAGAAKGLAPAAEKAIGDAYAGLKRFIADGYKNWKGVDGSIVQLESDPNDDDNRANVAKQLAKAGALQDQELAAKAQAVVDAAEKHAGEAIGIDWQAVKDAVIEIKKMNVGAGGTGLRVGQADNVSLKIEEFNVGGSSGNR
jgi:hypothetical protein